MAEMNEKEARQWGMGCHLAAFAGFFIPLGNVLGPLVIWLIKRNDSAFVDAQGKESLNFQISMTIYLIAAIILSLILIGLPLLIGLLLLEIIVVIIASIRASNGEYFRYPITIRFVT